MCRVNYVPRLPKRRVKHADDVNNFKMTASHGIKLAIKEEKRRRATLLRFSNQQQSWPFIFSGINHLHYS
jgi:hypothetical protein